MVCVYEQHRGYYILPLSFSVLRTGFLPVFQRTLNIFSLIWFNLIWDPDLAVRQSIQEESLAYILYSLYIVFFISPSQYNLSPETESNQNVEFQVQTKKRGVQNVKIRSSTFGILTVTVLPLKWWLYVIMVTSISSFFVSFWGTLSLRTLPGFAPGPY